MDELEQTITRYLLGELTEQEQAALEKSYFKDPLVFNQVLQVESALVDSYARGQLSSEVRERFEQYYLNHPSRRERVEFAGREFFVHLLRANRRPPIDLKSVGLLAALLRDVEPLVRKRAAHAVQHLGATNKVSHRTFHHTPRT